MQKNTNLFQENLSILLDEIQLATQWGKASILLTIHKSTYSQEKTKSYLRTNLEKTGFNIVELEINNFENNFIEFILQQNNMENTVFFLSNIGWGGGEDEKNGYRTLNIHRETFIIQNIKVIFFLTLNEATDLPDYAPDFWAFRHRVLKFGTPQAHNQKKPPARLMIWHLENTFSSKSNKESKISSLNELLMGIPNRAESVSVRVDLHYELSYMYWYVGDFLNATKVIKDGIDLAKTYDCDFVESLVKLKNGLAIINYEQGNYQPALELLDTMIEKDPSDCLLILSQAVILFAMGKRYLGIKKGEKAINACAENFRVWNSLGYLYYYAGNMENAITCFLKAIKISPTTGYLFESLALCYLAVGLNSKADVQLDKANENLRNRELVHKVMREQAKGNSERVVLHVNKALDTGKLTEMDIKRDLTLATLINPSDIVLTR